MDLKDELKKDIPTKEGMLKALDPRCEDGLPLLATLVGLFAALFFVVVVLNSLAGVVGLSPMNWIFKLPAFLARLVMAIVAIVTAAGGLVTALSFVKLLHLLYNWRYKDGAPAAAKPAAATPAAATPAADAPAADAPSTDS